MATGNRPDYHYGARTRELYKPDRSDTPIILHYKRARAATAAPTAPMFEPSTCAAPVAAWADVELVAVDAVGVPDEDPGTLMSAVVRL